MKKKRKNVPVSGLLTINIDVDGGSETRSNAIICLTHIVTLIRIGGKVNHQ